MLPTKSYIIATNPRSGSWLLSEALESTKSAGVPREWFETLDEQRFADYWNLDSQNLEIAYEDYFDKAIPAGTSDNGIFGAKCFYSGFESLPNKLKTIDRYKKFSSDLIIQKALPDLHFIWLRRRDNLRQAISYARAIQTQNWWLIDGESKNKAEVQFDLESINIQRRLLSDFDTSWFNYFAVNNIIPLEIYYEDFSENYSKTIISILEFLGIYNVALSDILPPRLKKQSDQITEQWVDHYQKNSGEKFL